MSNGGLQSGWINSQGVASQSLPRNNTATVNTVNTVQPPMTQSHREDQMNIQETNERLSNAQNQVQFYNILSSSNLESSEQKAKQQTQV
jgi:hypothetical protein